MVSRYGVFSVHDRLCIDDIISEFQDEIISPYCIKYIFEKYYIRCNILTHDNRGIIWKVRIEKYLEFLDELIIRNTSSDAVECKSIVFEGFWIDHDIYGRIDISVHFSEDGEFLIHDHASKFYDPMSEWVESCHLEVHENVGSLFDLIFHTARVYLFHLKLSIFSPHSMTRQFIVHDPYFKKAKALGYRARSAFKLIEIDEKYHLIHPGMRVLDLGSAPGSFLQVISHIVGEKGKVVGVDIQKIAPF